MNFDPSCNPHSPAANPLISSTLLAELLALHERMIMQLRLELVGMAGSAGFITKLLDEHEAAAEKVRLELASLVADASSSIVITGEASSPAAKFRVARFVQESAGTCAIKNQMTVKNPVGPVPPADQAGE